MGRTSTAYSTSAQPGGGFSWYFFASRATAYAKHPDSKAWLFDPETMKPYVNNPAFVRAAQDIIDALPYEPADQVNADLNVTGFDAVSWRHRLDGRTGGATSARTSTPATSRSFRTRSCSASCRVRTTSTTTRRARGRRSRPVRNFAPNEAYIGWGLYVMQRAVESRRRQGGLEHLPPISATRTLRTWMAFYPSGFQPYRNSSFAEELWAGAGLPPEFIKSYLASQADSYNHPNGAIEPRIPGIFQYYVAAEDRAGTGVRG